MPEAALHLSFTGGGARGYAHIGFLKALEELRLKPQEISGSSIGSLMAALYACGYSASEMEDRLLNLKLKEIRRYDYRHISRHRMKALGFWDLSPYQFLIHRWLEGARFKDMPVRLFIQATDLTHFRYVTFSARTHPEMEVSFAVRASCTYPCMITPVRYEGSVLVDGGVFVDLRQVRARRIIVSNVSSFGREHPEMINSIPKVLMAYLRFREFTSTPPFIFRPGGRVILVNHDFQAATLRMPEVEERAKIIREAHRTTIETLRRFKP